MAGECGGTHGVKHLSCPPSVRGAVQVWVKPSAEMQYLYGNHVLKSGLARITENTPGYTGVVIYNMADIPLGFGVTAKSTNECRQLDPSAIVAFHQADAGERGLALMQHNACPWWSL